MALSGLQKFKIHKRLGLSQPRTQASRLDFISQPWRKVGNPTFLEPDFSPRLRDKVWAGGLDTRLGLSNNLLEVTP